MKQVLVSLVLCVTVLQAHAVVVCETVSGAQFVVNGHVCPAGTFFRGF